MRKQTLTKYVGLLVFILSSLFVAAFTPTESASLNAGQIALRPAGAQAAVGEEFTLAVVGKLASGKQATGVEGIIVFDKTQLEFIGDIKFLTPEDWGTDFLAADTNVPGELFFSNSFIFGGTPLTGEFDIADVRFRVKSGASGPIKLSLKETKLISGADNLAAQSVGSTITIGGEVPVNAEVSVSAEQVPPPPTMPAGEAPEEAAAVPAEEEEGVSFLKGCTRG